jgi:CHAT domain-containing protein
VGDDDGVLSLNEVYGLRLPNTHMVVLSACQSGLGQYYRGEGIVSLIHPLLSAGVSTVVASLWPVESEPTSELMRVFHKARTERLMNSGDALREAQLHMIRTGHDHPYDWASFVVVGGNY